MCRYLIYSNTLSLVATLLQLSLSWPKVGELVKYAELE